jgi:DNA-binding CsgD family transcriptional regulator
MEEEIVRLYKQGMSIRDIVSQLHCSHYDVWQCFVKNGLDGKAENTQDISCRVSSRAKIVNDLRAQGYTFREIAIKTGIPLGSLSGYVHPKKRYVTSKRIVRIEERARNTEEVTPKPEEDKTANIPELERLGLDDTDRMEGRINYLRKQLEIAERYLELGKAYKLYQDALRELHNPNE